MNAMLSRLTKGERPVCDALVEGLSIHDTSKRLRISPNTTKTHIKRIYRRYNVHNQPQLIVAVLKEREERSHEDWLRLKDFAP